MRRQLSDAVITAWVTVLDEAAGTQTAIVCRASDPAVARLAAALQAEVIVHAGDARDLHARLSVRGPFDRLIDLSGGSGAVARFQCTAHHVRRGGVALTPVGANDRDARLRHYVEAAVELQRANVVVAPHPGDRRPQRERRLHAVAAAGSVRVGHDLVVVQRDNEVRPTLADSELGEVLLRMAPGIGEVIGGLPAATWSASGRFTSTAPDEEPVGSVEAPPLSLRRYEEVTCAPRMVCVASNGAALPDSFRFPERPRLVNPAMSPWDAGACVAPLDSSRRLAGTWFYADNPMRPHFGHAVTEQLSHLWAWPQAALAYPDLRVLLTSTDGSDLPAWEYRLLAAAGIPADRVEVVGTPVTVEHLICASPGYVINSYVHPAMRAVYDRAASHLLAGRAPLAGPARIFLTRGGALRQCLNTDEVEALFESHGFVVISPEELDLAEQVAVVRGADVVAGYAGSGMFHLAFCDRAKRVLAITQENYHAANEKLLSALRGHDLTLFRSRPEQTMGKAFLNSAFHSSFVFDFDREGTALARTLDSLPVDGTPQDR